jgi:uncharacterized protein
VPTAGVATVRPFPYLLLKLASRCNLNCSYCYWFRDSSVYAQPPLLTPEAERELLHKLECHIRKYQLGEFFVLLHGGEPTLFGKQRLSRLARNLYKIGERAGAAIRLGITTNAVLVDREWAQLFKRDGIGVTISIDGPRHVHDTARQDFRGRGSYERVITGLEHLRGEGIEPGVLTVCNPSVDPEAIVEHFVSVLGVRQFDILLPDATHENGYRSVSQFYIRLFDIWHRRFARDGVEIRILKSIVATLLGGASYGEDFGSGPIDVVTMLTDGSLEPLDVLRIAGHDRTRTHTSILTHQLQDVALDPAWRSAFDASTHLAAKCKECEFQLGCGGGYLPHRWSVARGYDNPSVYCEDLKSIFRHVWGELVPGLVVRGESPSGSYSLPLWSLSG